MIDELLIARKLTELREHLARVARRRPATFEEFRDDIDIQDATSLSLLVAVQAATDVALHLAADEGWGVPASYGDAFDLLVTHGVIDASLASTLRGCVAVRSRIAHGYASIDLTSARSPSRSERAARDREVVDPERRRRRRAAFGVRGEEDLGEGHRGVGAGAEEHSVGRDDEDAVDPDA